MALRRPDGIDLNPGRNPVRYGPWIPAGATAKAAPKPKPDPPIDISPSSDSSNPSLGPDRLAPPPKQKKRKRPDDPSPGDSTQQRPAGQPADRRRSRGPA
eukprot:9484636-Pyramimonas_sp.AAC.1